MAKIAKKVVGENDVVFSFSNGNKLICDISDLTTDMVNRLALHGIAQKVGDSYASAESVSIAIASAQEVWNNLINNVWATRAIGGKLAEALSRATGKPLDECVGKLGKMSDDEKKALRKHPLIKLAIAKIDKENAEKAAQVETEGGEDLSALF